MAKPFKNIGKRIDDFLKTKEYELNRTAKINVGSDKVDWSLENKLNNEGGVDSELTVSHKFDRDTLKLITSTKKSPKFEIKTSRFKSKFDLTASVQDPALDLKLTHKKEKYCINLDSKYDWASQYCDAQLSVAYDVNNQLRLGTKLKVEREAAKSPLALSDYNLAAQYNQNDDRTFVLTTENRLKKVNFGAQFKLRDAYTGYARVSYDFKNGDGKKDANNPLGYSVGIKRCISENSSIRAIYRHNSTASIMYFNKLGEQNMCAKIAANFDFTKPAAERANLQWKLVFGIKNCKACKTSFGK